MPRAGVIVASRYELVSLLGSGGFGAAWKARDRKLPGQQERVLKFSNGASESLDSLQREMEKAFQLTHPNICKLCDMQEDPQLGAFLVYVYGGESLTQLLERVGPLQIDFALRIVRDIARALDYAHGEDVMHHDVSPGNILIDAKGAARLTDFGVAKRAIARQTTGGHNTVVATSTSVSFHPVYVAPEVWSRGEARPASDQYALALVLCSMLEGRAFTGAYTPHRFEELSDAQNAALERALELNPRDRFASCTDFAVALSS